MYSVAQITLTTLLGGPVGGSWLMGLNFKRLGEPRKARITYVLGVLAMATVIAIGFATGPRAALWLLLAPVLVVNLLATRLQARGYQRHVAVQGRRGSSWRAAGLGVVSLAIYAVALLGTITVHFFATMPDKVMIGAASVFYTDGVSRAEAQRVGEELVTLDDGRSGGRWGVEVRRDGNRPVIAFITFGKERSDPSLKRSIHAFATPLSRDVYGDAPVDIWLIDGMFRIRDKLTWESRPN